MQDGFRKISRLLPILSVVASLFWAMTPAVAEEPGDSINIPTIKEARLHALLEQSSKYTSDVNHVLSQMEVKVRDSLQPATPNAELMVDFSNYFSNGESGMPVLLKAQELFIKQGWSVDLKLAKDKGWCGRVYIHPAIELPPVDAYLLDDNEYNTQLAKLRNSVAATTKGHSSSVYEEEDIPTPNQTLVGAFQQTRTSYVSQVTDTLNRISLATEKMDLNNPDADILVLDMEFNELGGSLPPKFMVDAQRIATAKAKGQWEIVVSPSRIFEHGFWQLSIRPIKL